MDKDILLMGPGTIIGELLLPKIGMPMFQRWNEYSCRYQSYERNIQIDPPLCEVL